MLPRINHFLRILVIGIFLSAIAYLWQSAYFEENHVIIKSDGYGYYDYLPSFFIHDDLLRKDYDVKEAPDLYERVNEQLGYVPYKSRRLNKYPIGTAVLQSPFFLGNYIFFHEAKPSLTGYETSFHQSVRISAFFYVAFALYLLFRLLRLYDIPEWIIYCCQILIVFGTPILRYIDLEASFSHVYSFFAIILFCYWAKMLLVQSKPRYFIYAAASFGLVVLLRNIDLLIILFIPFLSGSYKQLKNALLLIWKNKSILLLGLLAFSALISIQFWAWYQQCGEWLVYSYQDEGFIYWSEPRLVKMLFGYRKGLFLYTPLLLIATLTVFYFLKKGRYYLFVSWFSFFIFLSYVMSSWWSWWYGASFGLRPFINYYLIFIIPFALFLKDSKAYWKAATLLLAALAIPLNVIQVQQFQKRILQWSKMNKERYWQVFLKTEPQYSGLFWKEEYTFEWMTLEKTIPLGDVSVKPNEMKLVLHLSSKEVPNFKDLRALRLEIEDDFQESDQSKVEIRIKDDGQRIFWRTDHTLVLQNEGFNKHHRGYVNYKVPLLDDEREVFIDVLVFAKSEAKTFENMSLKIYSQELPTSITQ